jgi:dihydrofolate reductase
MNAFLEKIDAIVMGRKSFELFDKNYFPGKKVFVFSNTLEKNRTDVSVLNGDMAKVVEKIRDQSKGNIWLYGGAELTTEFLNSGWIDEMWLGIVPVILGKGKPLFQNISQRNYFTIVKSGVSDGYLSVKLKRK